MENNRSAVDWGKTKEILRDLLDAHKGVKSGGQVVLVGGSAMLAMDIRLSSGDIDIFSPEIDPDLTLDIEKKYQGSLGESFRIDHTPTENIWGSILIRDILENSPVIERIQTESGYWTVRCLSPETLFLVKMESGRAKDEEDLELIAKSTSPERLCARFCEVVRWVPDRNAVVGFSDRLVSHVQSLFDVSPESTISAIRESLPRGVVDMLSESWDINTKMHDRVTPENKPESKYRQYNRKDIGLE
ncbi:hypothetical protein ACSSZE_18370 [Acidithiobacillus caldus]